MVIYFIQTLKPIVILIRNPQDAVISFFLRENVSIKIGFEFLKKRKAFKIYEKIMEECTIK